MEKKGSGQLDLSIEQGGREGEQIPRRFLPSFRCILQSDRTAPHILIETRPQFPPQKVNLCQLFFDNNIELGIGLA